MYILRFQGYIVAGGGFLELQHHNTFMGKRNNGHHARCRTVANIITNCG